MYLKSSRLFHRLIQANQRGGDAGAGFYWEALARHGHFERADEGEDFELLDITQRGDADDLALELSQKFVTEIRFAPI